MNAPPTLIGRYEIVERVGRGGMGVLYRARDTVLDREVAIKVMGGDYSSEETARARFFREAKAAARLQHRNIVTVFEFAEHEETPYIVMEFLRGGSLASRLKEKPDLLLTQKLDIVIQLCHGLASAHAEGVVHRDVKPANVWICEDGSVKLLDFGIAKSSASSITSYGAVMGSPSYMSPEQIAGKDVDGRSDVFSAGVVLYELLGGRKPFDADSPTAVMMKITTEPAWPLQEVMPDLPSALVATVARALEKDPDARYEGAKELADDLLVVRAYLDDGKDPDVTVLTGETLILDEMEEREATLVKQLAPVPPVVRRRWTWQIGAVASAAVIGIIIMIAVQRGPAVASGESSGPVSPSPRPAARLNVASVPAGAALTVDGLEIGKITPADLTLADGHMPRLLRFSKAGYVAKELELTEAMVKSGVARVELEAAAPSLGRVDVTGAYPFAIFEDRQMISRAAVRHQLKLPSGRHTLRLSADSMLLNSMVTVDVPADGKAADVRAPGIGQIRVGTTPDLEVCVAWLGGVSLGNPTTELRSVAAGTYTVQIKCPDSRKDRQARVVVTAGESREVSVK